MGTLFWMVTLKSATGAAACGLLDCAPRPRPLPPPTGLPALPPPGFLPVLCSGFQWVQVSMHPGQQMQRQKGFVLLVWCQRQVAAGAHPVTIAVAAVRASAAAFASRFCV
jgi:hypothetical protein